MFQSLIRLLKKIREGTFIARKELYSDLNQSKPANPYFLNLWNSGEFHWNLFDHHRSSVIGEKTKRRTLEEARDRLVCDWVTGRQSFIGIIDTLLGLINTSLGNLELGIFSRQGFFFFSFFLFREIRDSKRKNHVNTNVWLSSFRGIIDVQKLSSG